MKQALIKIAPDVFKDTPVQFAYLYGSYGRGKPHPFSDLDIAVFVDDNADLTQCLELELSLSVKVDRLIDHTVSSEVRVINHMPLSIQGKILFDGQLIYTCNEVNRINFETRTRLLYFDFLPVIQGYQKAYIQRTLSGKYNGLH